MLHRLFRTTRCTPARRRAPLALETLESRCLLSIGFTSFPIPTQNSIPGQITTGPDGNLWFIEKGAHQIGRITPSGSISEFPVATSRNSLFGLTAGPDGDLWFCDQSNNKIGRINPLTASPGNPGITEFPVLSPSSSPSSITVGADGNLWFTEESANKIGQITTAGTVTEFSAPAGNALNTITSGPDGNLWYNLFSASVGVTTTSGITSSFPDPAGNFFPESLTTGPDGNLWQADANDGRIERITAGGNFTQLVTPTGSEVRGITAGPDGNLWYTETNALGVVIVGRLSPTGAMTDFALPNAGMPGAITTGPDGNLWFIDSAGNTIDRLTLLAATAADRSAQVGQTYSGPVATLSAMDPDARASDFTATISWGDGSVPTLGVVGGTAQTGLTVNGTHTYQQIGGYTATVTIKNVNGLPPPVNPHVNGLPAFTPSNTSTSFTFTIGPATHLAFLQQPSSAFVGQPLSPAVSVGVEDSNDHIVTSDTSTITLALASNNFAATLGGTLTAQAVNGIATFSNVSVNRPGNGYILLASDGNLTGAQSAPVTIPSVDVGVGTDNQARLLWDNVDGRARVQSISNTFQASNTQVYGPAGYTAQRVATGSDGLTRLLWTHADGSFAVWVLNASNTPLAEPGFAPLPGETAVDIAVGSDNKTRLLWDFSNGRAAVGTVDTNGNITDIDIFGPFAGWTATHLAAGSDGVTRLLWTHTSGAFAVWLLDASNFPTSEPSFGPFAGLTATDVAVGTDNKARVLLVSTSGAPNIWSIDNTTISNQQALGASPGYLPIALASAGDGKTRLVWDNQDGSVALYLLNQDNSYNSGTGFSPWPSGGQAPSHAPDFTGPDVPPPISDAPASSSSAAAPPAVVVSSAPLPQDVRHVAATHHAPPSHHHAPIRHHHSAAQGKAPWRTTPHHATSAKRK